MTHAPIILLLADTTPLNNEALFEEGLACVSSARRERALACRFQKDRNLSLGAGLLLERACLEYGLPGGLEITEGIHGKPAFRDYPEVFFNLSHAGTLVLCGIGEKPLGVDVEKHRDSILRHAEKLLTPSEWEGYSAEDSENAKREYFFRLWTGKESLMKCTGEGMYLPLRSFSLKVSGSFDGAPAADTEKKPAILLETPVDSHSYRFFEFFEEPGYSITLCIRDYAGDAPKLRKVPLF